MNLLDKNGKCHRCIYQGSFMCTCKEKCDKFSMYERKPKPEPKFKIDKWNMNPRKERWE